MAVFMNPRTRRLERDFREMQALKAESSILDFKAHGDPPERYEIVFKGLGLKESGGKVTTADRHEIELRLGMQYPMQMPEIHWKTPILHPNISGGRPCFGNFQMTPNVPLTAVVTMLWDMARLAIFNPYEGYGGERADRWRDFRKKWDFPVDKRILRDLAPAPPAPESPEEEGMFYIGARGKDWTPSQPTPPTEELKRRVEDWLRRHELMYDARVYTPEEWEDRGERYGRGSLLTITTEGPLYNLLNEGMDRELHAEWEEFLDSMRLWYELGYAWSVHLYPKD